MADPAGVPDIAFVSLGTTPGLRRAAEAFQQAARDAGVSCRVVPVHIRGAALRRQITVTDVVEALSARRAATGLQARAVVYSAVTAALLHPGHRPYAVRFDSPAALNRPGWAGAWQRARERSVLAGADVLLPLGDAAAAAVPDAARSVQVIPLHVPVDADAPAAGEREIDVVAYAGYPEKRGLDLLMRAWAQLRRADRRLVVAGIERERALDWLRRRGIDEPPSVEWRGLMDRADWLALLARARLFVNASRREDHGQSQLEALAAGAALVTVPSAGPYEALPIARRLAPQLVAESIEAGALAAAITAGFDVDPVDYARHAAPLLEPYSRAAVQRVFEERVLPALGLR